MWLILSFLGSVQDCHLQVYTWNYVVVIEKMCIHGSARNKVQHAVLLYMKPCCRHSTIAFSLGPGQTEVTVFGEMAEPWAGSDDKQLN